MGWLDRAQDFALGSIGSTALKEGKNLSNTLNAKPIERHQVDISGDTADLVRSRQADLKKTDEQVGQELTAGIDTAAVKELGAQPPSFVGPQDLDAALAARRGRGFETVTRDVKEKAKSAGRQTNLDRQSSMASYAAKRDATRAAAYDKKIADQQAQAAQRSAAISSILGTAGTIGGMIAGGPAGASIGGQVGQSAGGAVASSTAKKA